LSQPLRLLVAVSGFVVVAIGTAAGCRRATFRLGIDTLIMVALCNRADHNIFMLFLSSSSSFFSSPNLSGRRLDVYHTLAHGVALVRI